MLFICCPYCFNPADLVNGEILYPKRHELHTSYFWYCEQCNAYVSCHKNSTEPLGNLANGYLRKLRVIAHKNFDKIWQNNSTITRKVAYDLLSEKLNIPPDNCHIGMFDVKTCKKVINICTNNELN